MAEVKEKDRTIFLSKPDYDYMRSMIFNQAEKTGRQRSITEGFNMVLKQVAQELAPDIITM